MTLASVGEAGVAMEGKPRSKQAHLNREARASGPRTSEMSRVAPVVLVAVTLTTSHLQRNASADEPSEAIVATKVKTESEKSPLGREAGARRAGPSEKIKRQFPLKREP